jgi:hypothetical protein
MGWMIRLLFAAAVAAALPAAAQDGPCRQALALGLDVSGSVDGEEYRLQLDGVAAALTHPDVAQALVQGAAAPVRLLVYEWSGPGDQRVIAGWSEIVDIVTLEGFAAQLRATDRSPASPSTALGAALVAGAELLARQPGCWKRTLDISGDGLSNTGPRPQDLGHVAVLAEITVNALAIGAALPRAQGSATASELASYFERIVIRGPGAFVEEAEGFGDFERAMVRKLLRELEGLVVGDAE